jgi:bacterioferritin-associated ferredoxin
MIVCHCNVISCQNIRDAVGEMREVDPFCIVTPGKVFKAHGCKANCGGCMSLFSSVLEDAVALHGGKRQRARTRLIDATAISGVSSRVGKGYDSGHQTADNDQSDFAANQGDSHEREQGSYRSA